MIPKSLYNAAVRLQVMVERYKTHATRDFSGVFNKIDDTLDKLLRATRTDRLDELTRADLEKLITDLTRAQKELFDVQIEKTITDVQKFTSFAVNFEVEALKTVAKKGAKAAVRAPIVDKALSAVLNRPVQATGTKFETLYRDWSAGAIRRTNAAIRVGYERGDTTSQIIRNVTGTKSMRYKDGITEINRRNAGTVIHTSIQHVSATAREVTYEANKDLVQGVTWVSTLDRRTTLQCQALDGKKFKLGEGPRPPIHPNCRSTTVPDLDSEWDFLDEGATRASSKGYTAADQTYYEWLKEQPSEFQDTAVGPMRGKLLRDGGLSAEEFGNLQLDKNFQPLTLEEMKKVAPQAFQKAGLDE